MSGLALAALRAYLAFFALLARDRRHARREHQLIEGSLLAGYAELRAAGSGRALAACRAVVDHLPELSPLALIRKTRADAAYARGRGRALRRWPEIMVVAISALLIYATANNVLDGDNSRYWMAAAMLPVAAGTLCMWLAIRARRRGTPRSVVALAVTTALWPLWDSFTELDRADEAALLALAAAVLWFRGGRIRPAAAGFASLAFAPAVLLFATNATRAWGFGGLGDPTGQIAGLRLIGLYAGYLLVIALALWAIPSRSVPYERASARA